MPTLAARRAFSRSFSVDQSKHSLFGASKLASDVMVQEYGRYFDMPTCCLRGGCLTGPAHSGVELHGFLSYLVKCNLEGRRYTVYGYKAKQVRDNIHSRDVVAFSEAFIAALRAGKRSTISAAASGELGVDDRGLQDGRGHLRQDHGLGLLRAEPHRRSHLLLLRPAQDARRLPGLGPDVVSVRQTMEQIVESWQRRIANA